ncbi:zinc ribbon domain-containing protein [Paenibacillus kobensis]|uniref:zinc ribbon domain-containing protein n=1 Tax=Paenibacillus kobensis TaxID=59841 RepID=UPI001FE582EA|nr:zinc ribbon domain-containing protein [Paenibacillus kobensis]
MSIFDKMKQGASDAARKAQQTIEIARLNSQKSSREKDMTRLYTEMGEAMFRAYLTGETAESEEAVASCCEQLKTLKQEIESIEDRVKAVKLEKSCSCGKVVAINVKFCPDCGTRFTEQEPKPEMTMGEIRVICPDCDTENDLMARYCTDCGLELGKPKASAADAAAAAPSAAFDPQLQTELDDAEDDSRRDDYRDDRHDEHRDERSDDRNDDRSDEEREREQINRDKPTRFAYEE